MRSSPTRLILSATAAFLPALCSGCGSGGLTIGPRVETRYVIVEPGKPGEILENVKVRFRQIGDAGEVVEQDVGGWVAFPMSHWEQIKAALEKKP